LPRGLKWRGQFFFCIYFGAAIAIIIVIIAGARSSILLPEMNCCTSIRAVDLQISSYFRRFLPF